MKRLIVAIALITAVAWAILWLGQVATPMHRIDGAHSGGLPATTPIPTPAHTRPPPSYTP